MTKKKPAAATRTSIPFTFTPTSHLLVTAKIGRRSIGLVVDTGAGAELILDATAADALGVEREPGTESDDVRGVGTPVHRMQLLRVAALRLGSITIERPLSVAIDLTHLREIGGRRAIHGILGGTLLRARNAVIDYAARRISFAIVAPKTRRARAARRK
jgi:hypothetical protein